MGEPGQARVHTWASLGQRGQKHQTTEFHSRLQAFWTISHAVKGRGWGLPQPKAHDGFLYSLETCAEYKGIAADGTRIPFDRRNVDEIRGRTLDWAILDVISKYNNAAAAQLTPANLTR